MALCWHHDGSSLALLNKKGCLAAGSKTCLPPQEKGQKTGQGDFRYLSMLDRLPTYMLLVNVQMTTNLEEHAMISIKGKHGFKLAQTLVESFLL